MTKRYIAESKVFAFPDSPAISARARGERIP